MLDDTKSQFDSVNFSIRTPEGTANIAIIEDSPGKIGEIFFTIGKAGSTINAWAYALAKMVVHSLEHGRELSDIIADLSNITSARSTYTADGISCRSGPEALYIALMRYRVLIKDINKPKHSEDYRPARWGG